MYKNQLQERAQKEHVDLPVYRSIRTGSQHAPLFKATVSFNGAEFHSPDIYPTLKQAELGAAQEALTQLGPSRVRLAASPLVMDEQSVYKNLLQELAQKARVALPKYTTTHSGPPHQRVFTCTVEVAGASLQGQYALTQKNAEKNAAMFAWSVIKDASEGRGVDVNKSLVTKGTGE